MKREIDTDVLIAGAGPSGLALAAELARQGVAATIIDKHATGANTSRAAVVHARTLEVLEPLGVSQRLLEQGVKVPIFRIRDRDHALLTIDFAGIPSRYPFTLMCPQNRTERTMLARFEELGGSVLRPCEFVRMSTTPDHVAVELRDEAGTRTVRAGWLVGCDGMHSAVREQSGIPFEGAAYEQSFVLADVRMDWPLSRDEVSLFFSPRGLVVVAPLPDDQFRIVCTMDDAPELPGVDFVQSLLDERGPAKVRGHVHDVVWSSRFRLHHRLALTPRRGRILLCGDAAHVHSPAGGQGMNTGIQDAISLASTLTRVVAGADEQQLDAWARDRNRVARDVVSMTDRMTRMATLRGAAGKTLRNAALRFAGHIPPVRSAVANRLAELDTRATS
ncbi:MAG TPA: FAD-dependent monooxygenase [Candidatus Krumholzibacteria bacterium]|nr:FAD-dependent monooxygenase [Candidatus Krumholzibacteria bacterium]